MANKPAPAVRTGRVGLIKIREPLTRDEETELHVLIARGREAKIELEAASERSDQVRSVLRTEVRRGRAAEEELLAGSCALVKERAAHLGFQVDQEELEGAGLEGLVKALHGFDAERGVRFTTYAHYWISKMVNEAVALHMPFPEADRRQVLKFRRLRAQHQSKVLTATEVATLMSISVSEASRIMKLSADVDAGVGEFDDESTDLSAVEPWPEAEWVLDLLKEILGSDFTDFWMWTGRVMSLEELGKKNGVSKQAMAKRVAKWRRLVETSPHSDRMLAWLRAQ